MRRRRVACALALALASATPAAADDRERELEALRELIATHRERVEAFEREQRGLLEALESADRTIAALERAARDRAAEARAAREELAGLEARLGPLESRLARTRAAMGRRVAALYRAGEVGPVQVLFAAESLRDLLERVDALRMLLAHDRSLVTRFRSERDAVAAAREEAALVAERLADASAALEQRRREASVERATKRRLLAAVRGDRARERAVLADLEAAARALEETLSRLEDESEPLPDGGPPFAALRGRLPVPVDAPVLRSFGRVVDAEFHTQVFRKGVDFGAGRGDPVRAVARGRVRFAGWFRGYGRMVIVDHGGGFFTVSGHLDTLRVEPGDAVEAGDEIGTVGDSGSLSGPGLYFEIREGGRAVDPVPWLGRVPGAG